MTITVNHDIAALRRTQAKVLPPALAGELDRLAAQPQAQLSAMREFVSDPGVPDWTAETIRRILADPEHLAESAKQSHQHPLGFDSIVLENTLPLYRARLHVWWPQTALVIEDVHNHAWSFASRVLTGELRFTSYRETDDGMPFHHYRYRYGDQGGYGETTTVRLGVALDACLPSSTYYSFDLNERHRVAPVKTGRPVSTLVLTGALQRDGSDVYTEKARHEAGYRLLGDPYTPDALAQLLRRYLECL